MNKQKLLLLLHAKICSAENAKKTEKNASMRIALCERIIVLLEILQYVYES